MHHLFILIFFSIHLCVTYLHTRDNMADKFIADAKTLIAEIMKEPGKPVEGKVSNNLL